MASLSILQLGEKEEFLKKTRLFSKPRKDWSGRKKPAYYTPEPQFPTVPFKVHKTPSKRSKKVANFFTCVYCLENYIIWQEHEPHCIYKADLDYTDPEPVEWEVVSQGQIQPTTTDVVLEYNERPIADNIFQMQEFFYPADWWEGMIIDYFAMLPDEILLHVISFLPEENLASCLRVCKRWNRLLSEENTVLKELYKAFNS